MIQYISTSSEIAADIRKASTAKYWAFGEKVLWQAHNGKDSTDTNDTAHMWYKDKRKLLWSHTTRLAEWEICKSQSA